MTSAGRFGTDAEERRHRFAIQRLAQNLDLRAEEIQPLYEEILGNITQTARIRDYLVILVSRQVTDSIRSRDLTTPEITSASTPARHPR